jgi:hypothetical protein
MTAAAMGLFVERGSPQIRSRAELNGSFVVQRKHFSKANSSFKTSDLTNELPKLKKLVEKGRCDNYMLMTNATLSGRTGEALHSAVREVGAKAFLPFGEE